MSLPRPRLKRRLDITHEPCFVLISYHFEEQISLHRVGWCGYSGKEWNKNAVRNNAFRVRWWPRASRNAGEKTLWKNEKNPPKKGKKAKRNDFTIMMNHGTEITAKITITVGCSKHSSSRITSEGCEVVVSKEISKNRWIIFTVGLY